MVILGLEKPVEYGSRQIFDPTMANMVLNAQNRYVQAMREDYLQGREDLKEFNKNFGDFFSPIQKDMEWYDQNVTGATRDLINNLYAQGIDPLRSAEGRAAISRWVNSMPVGKINQLKQSAATANKYLENMGKLMAEGRYNPDAEKFFGRDLSSWDTLGGSGIWNSSSPIENMTMDEIIEPIIKNLDYTYDEARTKQANDGNDYYTVTEDRIRKTIADSMEDLTRNGTMPGYYYNKALQAVGGDRDKAISLYTDWLTNRGKDHLKEKFEPNKWKLLQKEHQNRLQQIAYSHRLSNSGGDGGSGRKAPAEMTSYSQTLLQRGIANWSGSIDPGKAGLDKAIQFGSTVRRNMLRKDQKIQSFMDFYSMPEAESSNAFRARFAGDASRFADAPVGGVRYSPTADKKKLYTADEITSMTLGYPGAMIRNDKARNNIPSDASMISTGTIYTAPTRNNNITQYAEVRVGTADNNQVLYYKIGETEASPGAVLQNDNTNWMPWSPETPTDQVIAPAGFSTIPSQKTVNQWSIMDNNLNKAAGLSQDPTKAGTGLFLDAVIP